MAATQNFHVTPDGPKPCNASVRSCKYGTALHAPTLQEAEALYQKTQGGLLPKALKPRRKMKDYPLTPATEEVLKRLREAGAQPLLVGGCVRDHLLGRESKDVDIEVYGAKEDGSSLEFADLLNALPKKDGFKAEEAGVSFSVLKLRYGHEDFDVALPRTEKAVGDHHRDFVTEHDSTLSFEEAASRRDFTLNSIGYDPVAKEYVDPHGGREDLKQGILRHVSDAFQEDPLRCMRAVNFAARFGFKLAPETEAYCKQLAPKYSTLAHERVEEELDKVFYKGKHCGQGLELMYAIGWSQQMKPFSQASAAQLRTWGDALDKLPPGVLRKAALAQMMEEEGQGNPTKFIESSVRGRQEITNLRNVLKASQESTQGALVAAHRNLKKRWPEHSNEELAAWTDSLGGNGDRVRNLPETPVPPIITGDSLIERGWKPGKELGAVMKKAQAIQDEEGPMPYEELLNRAKA